MISLQLRARRGTIRFEDEKKGFLQIFPGFFESFALRVHARDFFDPGYEPILGLFIYSCELIFSGHNVIITQLFEKATKIIWPSSSNSLGFCPAGFQVNNPNTSKWASNRKHQAHR
jgi:hypothetical protein